jgi:hypothetical protein
MGKGSRKKPKFGFNPKVPKLEVTKLQIAQREIDTCADLYFSFGDLVSIHLLISAAHEILGVFDKTFLKTGMFFDRIEEGVNPELLEDYRTLIKTPSIGFKHGAKDLDAVVELPWRLTEMLLFSAIDKYQELTKRPTPKMLLLRSWIGVHLHLFTAESEQMFAAPAIRERFPAYDREGFRKAFYPTFEKGAQQVAAAAPQSDILPEIWQQMFPKQTAEKG